MEQDRLLTEKEVAKILSVHPVTVKALRVNGELPHVRIGKRILYRLTTVQAFMCSNEVVSK